MSCYRPVMAWYSPKLNVSGKRPLVFSFPKGAHGKELLVPCGQCIGCRLDKSRDWAIRVVHEASLYEKNCFITLTYDDKIDARKCISLEKRDFVLFMKRLRKEFGSGIRFFHCGEYGARYGRPHHHACIFNFDFPDKVRVMFPTRVALYNSKILERLWPWGFSSIGEVTYDSAAYVARYVLKKLQDEKEDFELIEGKASEYITMSRKPGIGFEWLQRFSSDVYNHDVVVLNGGIKLRPPKFYDVKYDLTDHERYASILEKRKVVAAEMKCSPDCTRLRLAEREQVHLGRVSLLRRGLHEAASV